MLPLQWTPLLELFPELIELVSKVFNCLFKFRDALDVGWVANRWRFRFMERDLARE
jgi:hypothetical protein